MILGIDPGTNVTGYGIIEKKGTKYVALDFGCIRPPQSLPLNERYLIIYNDLDLLLQRFLPQVVVVETQYVNKNAQSAIKLGMARGTCIVACGKRMIPIVEVAPTAAKLAVAGTGRASKLQVQKMVQQHLSLKSPPQPEDASDALALALCYALRSL